MQQAMAKSQYFDHQSAMLDTSKGATARYQALDLQNVRVALMNEFPTHHLGQSKQDNARRQS